MKSKECQAVSASTPSKVGAFPKISPNRVASQRIETISGPVTLFYPYHFGGLVSTVNSEIGCRGGWRGCYFGETGRPCNLIVGALLRVLHLLYASYGFTA